MTTLQERMTLAFPQPQVRGLQADIAKLCMVKPASVSAWFKQPEKVASISRSHAELICRRFNLNISPAWLAEGQGDMLPTTATATLSAPSPELTSTGSASNHALAHIQQSSVAISFNDAVRVIAQKLMEVDEATGRRAMGVLADLATDPQDFERLARATAAVIETGKRRAA